MDLRTTYLNLQLRTPLVVSACGPLSEDIDNIKRMEDAGASAVVLLFACSKSNYGWRRRNCITI